MSQTRPKSGLKKSKSKPAWDVSHSYLRMVKTRTRISNYSPILLGEYFRKRKQQFTGLPKYAIRNYEERKFVKTNGIREYSVRYQYPSKPPNLSYFPNFLSLFKQSIVGFWSFFLSFSKIFTTKCAKNWKFAFLYVTIE